MLKKLLTDEELIELLDCGFTKLNHRHASQSEKNSSRKNRLQDAQIRSGQSDGRTHAP
jgi:hypothetical protein